MSTPKQEFKTPEDVERETGISVAMQRKLRMRPGAFCPYVKIGKTILYPLPDWHAFIASRRRAHTRDAAPAPTAA